MLRIRDAKPTIIQIAKPILHSRLLYGSIIILQISLRTTFIAYINNR
jgi:hypothetical protein